MGCSKLDEGFELLHGIRVSMHYVMEFAFSSHCNEISPNRHFCLRHMVGNEKATKKKIPRSPDLTVNETAAKFLTISDSG